MSSAGDPSFHKNLFPDDLIPDILELVLSSWKKFEKPKPDDKENPINIRFAMFLRSQLDFPKLPFYIDPEITLPDEKTGEVLGRMDIRFLHGEGGDENIYFTFECKRLRYTTPSGSLVTNTSDYVGEQGMMCFISGKYSSHLFSGGMLGYVLDGKNRKARSAIEKLIKKNRKSLLMENGTTFAPSQLNPQEIDETKHNLSGRSFTLYHMLLPN